MRHVLSLTNGWRFRRGDLAGAAAPEFNASDWEAVRVPHDWAIQGPFAEEHDLQITAILEDGETIERRHSGRTGGLPHAGQAWYRIAVELPDSIRNQFVRIEFDGVMSRSQVYLNGEHLGGWPYGYASFMVDASAAARPGRNLLAVRVDNPDNASRWYPGAGIYRHVRVVLSDRVHIAPWGTAITTPAVSAEAATVLIRTRLANHGAGAQPITLQSRVLSPSGDQVALASHSLSLAESATVEQSLDIADPARWSPSSPSLYTLEQTVFDGDRSRDQISSRFGIRSIQFTADRGFLLNDQVTRFNGVCLHHDLGPLGAAVNKAAIQRQLRILQDGGCNAIRTSHNPPAPELLDLCDEMGFLVIDEAFDEWRAAKCANGYHSLFDDWAEKDLRAMIQRDRNHPCVVMWSIGNEIREQTEPTGAKVAQFLVDICHDEDPTRPTTAGLNSADDAIACGLAATLDVPGWNYKPMDYARYRQMFPNWPMYGSETASCISSRGEYYFPVEEEKPTRRANLQANSYDLATAGWATTPDQEFTALDENPTIMGEFVWTGFDYLGEPTPYGTEWPSRSSYFGLVDLCGIPKSRYWLYKSRWSSEPVLYIHPHWTWPSREGQPTPIHCYTNYAWVELFVNGVSMGRRCRSPKFLLSRHRIVWNNVVYQPGELRAVAYDAAGKQCEQMVIRTATAPARVELRADRTALAADGDDMCFVHTRIVDAAGTTIPDAEHLVQFSVTGPAVIVAVGNGNAATTEPFVASERHAFHGECMLFVRSLPDQAGEVTISAAANGLTSGALTLTTA